MPKVGSKKSLKNPTDDGPRPKPRKLSIKNNIAEAVALIRDPTRACAVAILLPKYTLNKNAGTKPKIKAKY